MALDADKCPIFEPGESCPGFARWRTLPNYQTEVILPDGRTYIPLWNETNPLEKANVARLRKAWSTYGEQIKRATAGKFPVAFFMGILCAESLGNPNACAPCGIENDCHLKNCSQCCAFGIMQITNDTAYRFGKVSGPSLLGNPEESFRVATNLLLYFVNRYKGLELPKLAGAYNSGCFRCRSGAQNMFGNSENLFPRGGYAQRVVTFANTFVALGLDKDGGASGGSAAGDGQTLAGLGMIAGAAAIYWFFLRK